jgi:hypothetical protein
MGTEDTKTHAALKRPRRQNPRSFTPADELNLTVPLIDQGVDALSAVTVGSWFS